MKTANRCACLAASALAITLPPFLLGQPVEGPGGHYYEVIASYGIPWEEANLLAEESTYGCFQGHLATITSMEEDVFIDLLRLEADLQSEPGVHEYWIGGFQGPQLSAGTVTVPGTACSWLAGMFDGALANVGTLEPPDVAPDQSPVLAPICVEPGATIHWSAVGLVGHPGVYEDQTGADGAAGYPLSHETGEENGLSDVSCPINALIGVFLGPDQPDLLMVPAALDFSSPLSRDYLVLTPELQQVFFMGDGLTSDGEVQALVSPAGATRLFLGSMDGYGWANNSGEFVVDLQSDCDEPAGSWQWVNHEGPIPALAFGGLQEESPYANWALGEPNDAAGMEDGLAIGRTGQMGWNDEGSAMDLVWGYVVEFEDLEAPIVECMAATNPSGKNVPKAGNNVRSGQNPDGFYQLLAEDGCDAEPTIFVRDTGSDFIAGPFVSGEIVKLTQAPGITPNLKPMGGGVIAHIQLKGDAILFAVDAAGNVSEPCTCLVAPKAK